MQNIKKERAFVYDRHLRKYLLGRSKRPTRGATPNCGLCRELTTSHRNKTYWVVECYTVPLISLACRESSGSKQIPLAADRLTRRLWDFRFLKNAEFIDEISDYLLLCQDRDLKRQVFFFCLAKAFLTNFTIYIFTYKR